MISVVIPFYNRWDLTHSRLNDLRKFLKVPAEVILVDDASPDTDCKQGVGFWQSLSKTVPNTFTIRYTRNEKNLGFGGSMNRGIEKANGDVVILLSNDVQVFGDVFSSLEVPERTLMGGEYLNRRTGWNEFEINGKKLYIPYVNGWMLLATKSSWRELGGFDVSYYPYDFEDVDLSTKAHDLGYNLVGLHSPLLSHIGGATIATVTNSRIVHTERHRNLYISKWADKLLLLAERLGTFYG